MQLKNAIIVRTENTIEAYTGFKKMCVILNIPYNYLKRLPYPINKDLFGHPFETDDESVVTYYIRPVTVT